LNPESQDRSAVGAVVASKNSASFATTIQLSTIVNKDSAAAGPAVHYHRGTVMNATLTLLFALVSHFVCLY